MVDDRTEPEGQPGLPAAVPAEPGTGPAAHPDSADPTAVLSNTTSPTGTHQLFLDPPNYRARQYGVLAGLVVVVIVFVVLLMWVSAERSQEAKVSREAATNACRQVVSLGQPCAAASALAPQGVSGDALVPAPAGSLTGTPVAPVPGKGQGPATEPGARPRPQVTNEFGVPQPYQPGTDALIVGLSVTGAHLVITYSDGARVDVGAVRGDLLSLTLGTFKASQTPESPSPTPPPQVSPSEPPSPTESTPPTEEPTPSGS